MLSSFAYLHFQSQTTANLNKDNPPFIAVIPFEQIGLPEDTYLGEGITEDVLIQLTKFDDLNIISKATTFKFQPTDEDLYQKMAAFGTTHILQGEIKKINHQLMLLVHLVQLSDNREVWSERFIEAEENLFNLAPKVALALSKKFNLSTTVFNSSAKTNYKPSIPAYNAYLRGQHLMRPRSRDGLEKSIEEFDIALSIDNNYTAAFLAKATAYLLLNRKEGTDKAETMALEVIRKDKQNGDAYALLGNIHSLKNEYIKALTFYEIALALSPDDPMINYWYSLVFRKIGNLKAAMKYGKIAAESAPLHPVINSGYIYTVILADEYLLAEKLINQSNQIFENSFLFLYVKGHLAIHQQHYTKALVLFEQSLSLEPDFDRSNIDKFYCLAKLKKMKAVNSYLSTIDEQDINHTMTFAILYGELGEIEKGISYLKRGADKGFLPIDILTNDYYIPYRTHPVYQEILQAFGLREFAKQYNL